MKSIRQQFIDDMEERLHSQNWCTDGWVWDCCEICKNGGHTSIQTPQKTQNKVSPVILTTEKDKTHEEVRFV